MKFLTFFGSGKLINALRKGAIVIDVRTPHEYDNGRVRDSINIPMDRIDISKKRIQGMNRPVIICSNSAYDSNLAIKILKETGLKEVYNGGNWERLVKLQQKI